MASKIYLIPLLLVFLSFTAGCSRAGAGESPPPGIAAILPDAPAEPLPAETAIQPAAGAAPTSIDPAPASITAAPSPTVGPSGTGIPTSTNAPTGTATTAPTAAAPALEVGREITIEYLRELEITGSAITFEQELDPTFYYRQYIVSYLSEGNKIYALLTIPAADPPPGRFKAIVFNHGYIPPEAYRTAERYTAYVDYLARYGFVVMKIDYRGHGSSEGEASGSYFSPGYTIDSIAALRSLQTLDIIDPQGIGMWGHSMAGNLVLRAMLVEPEVKAGVIWAGAVYSYVDLAKYGINDTTYRPPESSDDQAAASPRRRSQQIFEAYGMPDTGVEFWQAVSLTENLEYLNRPLQIHHAEDDTVVNIGYSYDLAGALQENGKAYELYSYEGGGHNLISPYFDQAMLRTVEFFRNNL